MQYCLIPIWNVKNTHGTNQFISICCLPFAKLPKQQSHDQNTCTVCHLSMEKNYGKPDQQKMNIFWGFYKLNIIHFYPHLKNILLRKNQWKWINDMQYLMIGKFIMDQIKLIWDIFYFRNEEKKCDPDALKSAFMHYFNNICIFWQKFQKLKILIIFFVWQSFCEIYLSCSNV